MRFPSYKSSVIDLKGGINENVSSLELLAGELIDCKNYMISESAYGGYTSVPGFEAFDGIITPSREQSYIITLVDCSLEILATQVMTGDTSGATATALTNGVVVSGSYIGGDARVIVEASVGSLVFTISEPISTVSGLVGTLNAIEYLVGGTVDYHTHLDAQRALVQEVPGEGDILGLHTFESKTYAFRKKVGVLFVGMYVEDPSSGWLEVDTSVNPIAFGDSYFRFSNYNFFAGTGTFSMYWVDGVNKARSYDGTTVTLIDNAGMDPEDKPTHIATHNYYLFLGYRGASLQYSDLGLPASWATPGEIGVGDEITNLVGGVKGSLIIYLRNSTSILNGIVASDFSLEPFSLKSGGRANTAQRAFGTVMAVDDRGLTTLKATDAFGDYAAASISQKFKKSLLDTSREITCSTVSRDLNQYRVFFSDGGAIFVSFDGTELKGATFIEYPKQVHIVSQGEDADGTAKIIFASKGDGFVYKMDSGTSFNGVAIVCRLTTAYFHYGSPRQFKAFKRATIEVRGEVNQEFIVKIILDYSEPLIKNNIWNTLRVYTSGIVSSSWGEGEWGNMIWGQLSAATNRLYVYLAGVGTNASYKVLSKETYRPTHTIQNVITDFEVLGRRI